MSRRIFLDVGAHTGETLAAVLDPAFRFDEIFCFEPSRLCIDELKSVVEQDRNPHNVHLMHYGLWNKEVDAKIFDAGSDGGSMWKKDKLRPGRATEVCEFQRANDWFAENIVAGDTVFLKLNCEGAECDILDDLLDSGEFDKVTYAMIDFDVRKIASQKHRQAEILARFAELGIAYPRVASTKQVMKGATHQERIKNWLRVVEA
jgi:FkbM family methyltransferase